MEYPVTIICSELEFSLTDRLLVISWPQQGIRVFCEFNETLEHMDWCWREGTDTPEKENLAGLMKSAGYWYADDLRRAA
jgi:hypothetical protein